MVDRVVLILLFFAVIAAACVGSSLVLQDEAQAVTIYAIDTAVEQANKPLSPSDALAATSARLDTGSSPVWPVVTLLLLGIVAAAFILAFTVYGEGFLKQYRLATKKRKHKPGPLRTLPPTRPLLPPGDAIIEGEAWND